MKASHGDGNPFVFVYFSILLPITQFKAVIPIFKAIAKGRLIELPPCDKNQALRTLAEKLCASADIPAEYNVFDNVIRREEQAITYLKYGIACPHARSEAHGGEMACVIGWSPDGIDYGNTDGWPVHLILMYYVPSSARNAYLTELATLARAIEDDETKHELVNLKDLEDVSPASNRGSRRLKDVRMRRMTANRYVALPARSSANC